MTDAPDTLIQLAFCAFLQTPDLGYPVSWPFVPFSPIDGVSYLDVRGVLRAAPNAPGLAYVGSVWRTGVFQIDAVVPNDVGETPGIRLAALVAARFVRGVSFVAGAFRVKLDSVPNIAAALMDAPWLRFPVSIPYNVST